MAIETYEERQKRLQGAPIKQPLGSPVQSTSSMFPAAPAPAIKDLPQDNRATTASAIADLERRGNITFREGGNLVSERAIPLADGGVASKDTYRQLAGLRDREAAFKSNLDALRSTSIQRGATPSQAVVSEHNKNMALTLSGAKTKGEKAAAIAAISRGEDPAEAMGKYHAMKKELYAISKLPKEEQAALRRTREQIASNERIAEGRGDVTLTAAGMKSDTEAAKLAAKQETDAAKLEFNRWRELGMQEHRKEKLLSGAEQAQRAIEARAAIADAGLQQRMKLFEQDQSQSMEIAKMRDGIAKERNYDMRRKAEKDYSLRAAEYAQDAFGDKWKQTLMALGLQLRAKSAGAKQIEQAIGKTMVEIARDVANNENIGAAVFGAMNDVSAQPQAPAQQAPIQQPATQKPKMLIGKNKQGQQVSVPENEREAAMAAGVTF